MSVQLIVYPQSYEGQTTTTTTASPELITDGQTFSSVSAVSPYVLESPNTYITFGHWALSQNYPNIINSWYLYRQHNGFSSYEPYPTSTGGNLVFTMNSSNYAHSAVYQKITNLTIGQRYKLTLGNISSASNEILALAKIYEPVVPPFAFGSGNTYLSWIGGVGTPFTTFLDGTDVSGDFYATHTEHILYIPLISNHSSGLYTATITSISLKAVSTGGGATVTTGGFDADELHDQVICDLYADETIPLTLSVDDFKNVASKTQSYSKAFNLPATKNNNKIFDNLYEVTKTADFYTFNPYMKSAIELKENGFSIFKGFLRLIDINDKDGEISYNVNLFSKTVALADTIKNRKLNDLNFSELDHAYNRTTINNSWNGILPLTNPLPIDSFANNTGVAGATTTDVLKYPLVDWTGNVNRYATTQEVANGATDGNPSIKRLEDVFRPFVKLKYIIDNIFNDAGFTYTSTFLNDTYFSKLYMDFNWGGEARAMAINEIGSIVSAPAVALTGSFATMTFGTGTLPTGFGYDASTGVFTALTANQEYVFNYSLTFATIGQMEFRWRATIGGTTSTIMSEQFTSGLINTGSGGFTVSLNAGDTIFLEAKELSGTCSLEGVDLTINTNSSDAMSDVLLSSKRGELNQWKFFKGIMTLFNLVTVQDEQTASNLIIEPYNDLFEANNKTIDWTYKVDISDIKLKPIKLHKETIFKYSEDENDYPFAVYKSATGGFLYGSQVFDATGFDLTIEQKEIKADPFAATIIKPLFDSVPNFIAPVIYGGNPEGTEFKGIENKPRILFDTGIHTFAKSYFIPAQNGLSGANEDDYSLFSHTSLIQSTAAATDLNFGGCQLIGIGLSPLDNLYQTYYAKYFADLYNSDTKTMTLKVLLTAEDCSQFNFYDKVFIKNREYRVNKIDYKPNDLSTVEFILIP